MSSSDQTIIDLLARGPFRSDVGRKQLTLALEGVYIASTTSSAKPRLVWETEKSYPRYYVPTASLHEGIRGQLAGAEQNHSAPNGHKASGPKIEVSEVEVVKGKGNDSEAIIERLTVGKRSTTWVRFIAGPLKDLVRFERNDIGRRILPVVAFSKTLLSQSLNDILT